MIDYNKDINPNAPGTGSEKDLNNIISEYNGVPSITENEDENINVEEFDCSYSAPKRIIVKRFKLKKN